MGRGLKGQRYIVLCQVVDLRAAVIFFCLVFYFLRVVFLAFRKVGCNVISLWQFFNRFNFNVSDNNWLLCLLHYSPNYVILRYYNQFIHMTNVYYPSVKCYQIYHTLLYSLSVWGWPNCRGCANLDCFCIFYPCANKHLNFQDQTCLESCWPIDLFKHCRLACLADPNCLCNFVQSYLIEHSYVHSPN